MLELLLGVLSLPPPQAHKKEIRIDRINLLDMFSPKEYFIRIRIKYPTYSVHSRSFLDDLYSKFSNEL